MRLCVVGFGLIGGSVAAAHKAQDPKARVVAVDLRGSLESEAARALADVRVAIDDDERFDHELASADLVVLAAPVRSVATMLDRVLARAKVVTDCGSTKREIVERAEGSPQRSRFVPGHPLAGGSDAGAGAARADLFVDRAWVLCDAPGDAAALALVRSFVAGLGAVPVLMSAAEHDRALALTSHAPQVVASALVVLSERGACQVAEGPGFASTTRIAGGNPAVWGDILGTNADEIARALREIGAELARVADALERSQPEAALELIRAARQASLRRRSA
jgi:prephenate dehydrogenase